MNAKISILLLIIPCFFSCSKESDLQKSDAQNISLRTNSQKNSTENELVNFKIIEDRLAFQDSEDFAKVMWHLDSHSLEEWEESLNFVSFRKQLELSSQAKETFDLQLASLLNRKGIIQINPYLFKFIPENRKLLILNTKDLAHLEEFEVARSANTFIEEFSFDDDVWTLLESKLKSIDQIKALCTEPRAKNKTVIQEALSNDISSYIWHKARLYLQYNRFGIWEKVKCVFTNQRHDIFTNSSFIPAQVNSWEISYHFNERCGSIIDGSLSIPNGQYSEEIILVRSDKKALEEGQSSVLCNVNFEYLPNNFETSQNLSLLLNDF